MTRIKISTIIDANLAKAWNVFTQSEYITRWNFASDEWECPTAINDFQVGGRFNYRMQAKDGSFGFDFEGKYLEIENQKRILFQLGADLPKGRQVEVFFEKISYNQTKVIEIFDPESENSLEMQKNGWQLILNNYKKCAELNNDE
jgi:uncharacterized protein YndB with AHSA1/START domain